MTTPLPESLYSAAQVRELDRRAIQDHGIPSYTLMGRAGEAAFEALLERWPGAQRVGVLCGPGNNGGDGYVIARLARAAGLSVWLVESGDAAGLKGDPARAREDCLAAGGVPLAADAPWPQADVLVDALLGTGLDRIVSGPLAGLIERINGTGVPVLAIDIPSGLHADNGAVMGVAVRATLTMSFIGLKTGLCTGEGPACCGQLRFDTLGVPRAVYQDMAARATRLDAACIGGLRPRPRNAHKGAFGHVLVVGGDRGMPG
ncbi:MAG TPA: NAD(P)H-hydrate epimerase, partial [Thioalkalivibrio sp.]|nr:NAD(P)H-hydrate epimerase [Thioalkalivibrio sp.]